MSCPDGPNSCFLRSVPVNVKGHDSDLMLALHKQQQNGNLCDVWLVIEDEKFPAHKAVLAAFSSYFQTLFENGVQTDTAGSKACNVKEIHLSSVKKSTFLPILHFLYTSNLHLFKENVGDILRTSRKLQISSIVRICNKLVDDEVVLPSLKDAKSEITTEENESERGRRSNILYVDLSNGDDDDQASSGKESSSVESNDRNEIGSSTPTEHHRQFQNHFSSHLDDQVGRTRDRTNSHEDLSSQPENNHIRREPLQLKSVYSISSTSQGISMSSPISSTPQMQLHSQQSVSNPTHSGIFKKVTKRRNATLNCPYCNRIFSKMTNLKRHIHIKHSSNYQFDCPKCDKKYAIKQSLRYHLINAHHIPKSALRGPTFNIPTSPLPQAPNQNPSTSPYVSPILSSSCTSPLDNQKVSSSMSDRSPESSFLPQSLASPSVDDDLSLNIPSTSLFPSIGNLEESSDFDKPETSNTGQADSTFLKSPTDSFRRLSESDPVQVVNDHSTPVISNVGSITESFVKVTKMATSTSSVYTFSVRDLDGSGGLMPEISVKSDPGNTSGRILIPEIPEKTEEQISSTNFMTEELHNSTLPADSSSSSSFHRNNSQYLYRSPVTSPSFQKHVLVKPINKITEPIRQSTTSVASHSSLMRGSQQPSTSGTSSFLRTNASSNSVNGLPRCTICGKPFEHEQQMKYHMKQCSKCPFCNRIFSQYNNMKRHMFVYHSKHKPHTCTICGRGYGIKWSMQVHMKRKHGVECVTRKYTRKMKSGNDR